LLLAFLGALIFLLFDFTPLFIADVAPRLGYRFYPVPGPIYFFFVPYLFSFFAVGFIKLLQFLQNSFGTINNQAKYVFFASLVGVIGGVSAFFPVFNLRLPVVSHFALPLYLLITTYAIVKHHLLDIRIVFREGLVYSFLTVFFAGFYALLILLSNRLLQSVSFSNEYLTMLVVVFVSVLVFQPLRDQIQWGVDRLFFRGEYYYRKKIKELSVENIKLYRSLLQAEKLAALGTISAGMAHEIKNPLASIKALTQVLLENITDQEFVQKYLDIVPRQVDRINQTVEDLLAFGRPKELVMEEVKIDQLLTQVLRLVENQCRKSNIEIVKEFHEVSSIKADKEKISQVFMNMVLNAMQAMPQGGKIWIGVREANAKEIEIEISDTGVGIPEDQITKIFDPFFTTKDKGTGMGLALTYRIVKEHGGRIEVESELNAGTTFKIFLPYGYLPNKSN
ncbi:MAG: ATP-binding protein, partial [Candidatus Margulisiibacteriota bacterium]